MQDAHYVEADSESTSPVTSSRWQRLKSLLIVAVTVAGILLATWLLYHQPATLERNVTIERLQAEQAVRCEDDEIATVTEFATGLYRMVCVAKGGLDGNWLLVQMF